MRSSRFSWKKLRMVKYFKDWNFVFLGTMQEVEYGKFVDASTNLKSLKIALKWQFWLGWPRFQSSSLQVAFHKITRSTWCPFIWRLMWPNIETYWQKNYKLMRRTHWMSNISKKLLYVLTEVLIQRQLYVSSSTFFFRNCMWKNTPMIFNIYDHALQSFLSPLVIRWKGFLRGSKKMLGSKSRWI